MTDLKKPNVFADPPKFPVGTRVYWWQKQGKGQERMSGIVKFQEGQFVRVTVVSGRKPPSTEVNVFADELQRVY